MQLKKEIRPTRKIAGSIKVPGDKSIAHRAALLAILSKDTIKVTNFPDSADCHRSLEAARAFGVNVESKAAGELLLKPPRTIAVEADTIVDCGNSGTTVRLLAGLASGTEACIILSGDESLSSRPMKRIVTPLTQMGAEVIDTDGHLPLKVRGTKLLPYEYRMPVASAQVKSALLLAGLASGCSVTIREEAISRDHTELMIGALGGSIDCRVIKPIMQENPDDPRRRQRIMPETFRKETILAARTSIEGGTVDIPGDISTAAFFFAAAALSGGTVTVEGVGLNTTRTAFLEHLKAIGCKVEISDRATISGEPRGNVSVTGGTLKAVKLSGEKIVGLIDEIPIIAVMAAFAKGTTVIRDAAELKVKESDRLMAVAHNLEAMGVSCGLLEDGLIIEGKTDLGGADFKSFGDHRIAMAFSIAGLFGDGPSTIDDGSAVDISCRNFYELLDQIKA